jgi:hypothetical protein
MNREGKRKSVRICGLFFSCLRLLLAYLHRREDPEARSYLEGLESALEAATWRALEGLGLGSIPRG